ncbi:hypothetical protein BZG36_02462 [Bifiguratus adelaidae]|uniref:Plastocyanin-like domain-containing protein n=1 Tax=Bifiguratus adelaidae TaxID=1938954 RepID=A0A261Y3P9_9FUNG|nr:hypothetical protein BZG36_02462 [Bifiguratus adelaidae]
MSDNVAHALSGAGGGIVSMILTYPLITISSRLQVQRNSAHPSEDDYKNTGDAFVKILKTEGPQGLYSGINSALFGISVTNGIYYYFYEAVKAVFEKRGKRSMTTGESMLAGAIAGSAVVFVTNPIWTVNTRITTYKKKLDKQEADGKPLKHQRAPTTMETAMEILKTDGFKGFYAGLLPALILVINPIIQYTVFEQLKARWMKLKSSNLSAWEFFVLGAVSKLAATGITYPYIVLKARQQAASKKSSGTNKPSLIQELRDIFKAEGFAGLYNGLSSKLLQSVLTSAFLFMMKEELFRWAVWTLVVLGARKPARVVEPLDWTYNNTTVRKLHYFQYDSSYTHRMPQPAHLGLLGPVIRAEVGDNVTVHCWNKANVPISMHPHGLHYTFEDEGALYDGSSANGSSPADGHSIVWGYHSHVHEDKDVNAGLVGPIVVYKEGTLGAWSPRDPDREFFAAFMAINDAQSSILSNSTELHYTINGYTHDIPDMVMEYAERVRWYLMAWGGEMDVHTAVWSSGEVMWGYQASNEMTLMPASFRTVDMLANTPGRHTLFCKTPLHRKGGMEAAYVVREAVGSGRRKNSKAKVVPSE